MPLLPHPIIVDAGVLLRSCPDPFKFAPRCQGTSHKSGRTGIPAPAESNNANITPGSSSNPLSPSDENADSNAATIPVAVTVVQTLLLLPGKWTLECEFSFDFHSAGGAAMAGGALLGRYLVGSVFEGSKFNVSVILCERDDSDAAVADVVPPAAAKGHDEERMCSQTAPPAARRS